MPEKPIQEDNDLGSNSQRFIQDLMKKFSEPRTLTTTATFYSDPHKIEHPPEFLKIVGIDKKDLSNTACNTIEYLEDLPDDNKENWVRFKWKVFAFINIQDVFESCIHEGADVRNIFWLWYFYYESKFLFIESILCGLNGFYAASNALLRPFLEFSLLQNYYYRTITKLGSFAPLEKYFEKEVHPNWNTMLKKALPNDDFCKPIRQRIDSHLKGLSMTSSHPYSPEHSSKQLGTFNSEPTLLGIYFWTHGLLILDAVIWLYLVNFPMLFHPKDVVRKFGFNGPVGTFIHEMGGSIIEKSMEKEVYEDFCAYSNIQQEVRDRLDWYDSFKNLSDDDIAQTWDPKEDGQLEDFESGFGKIITKMRGIKEMLALKRVKAFTEVDEKFFPKIMTYKTWNSIQINKTIKPMSKKKDSK